MREGKTVYKYECVVNDWTVVALPEGAEIIHIDCQRGPGMLTVWAIVDPQETEQEHRVLLVRGTGHAFTGDEGEHLATVVTNVGLVWHVFAPEGDGVREHA